MLDYLSCAIFFFKAFLFFRTNFSFRFLLFLPQTNKIVLINL